MKLQTRWALALSATVVALLGVSEWGSYRQTERFLREHEALMQSGADSTNSVAALREEKRLLYAKQVGLRLLQTGVTVTAVLAVLGALWHWLILSRVRQLLVQIHSIGRGTWTQSLPVREKDEIGDLTEALNQLGDQLTATVYQFAAASKLSALALIGQSVVRKADLARAHILAITVMLRVAKDREEQVPDAALRNLDAVAQTLKDMQVQVDSEFNRQFLLHAPRGALVSHKYNEQPSVSPQD